jgi:uncharacterized RDD family membrane protein YckC
MAKTVEITTTQNVTIEYELAALRERIGAWLLDALAVGAGYFVLFVLVVAAVGTRNLDDGWGRFFTLAPFFLFFFYHILLEILNNGQTLGKRAMAIKVVRLDGKDPTWSDVVLRTLLQVADVLSSSGFVAALLIKTTPKSQRLGDMAAHTTVIKLQGAAGRFSLRDILNIASLDNYQPVYPQVRILSERDMIFIKSALARYAEHPNNAHGEVIDQLVERLMPVVGVEKWPSNNIEFLRTLLRDYIVLTR